ncbi:MAG: hypothetical protein E5V16_16115 [Mesorhizobium sp.]|nr:MAG: hypothetical protein E5V16_16115 [Mesorhizobium sp.]
MRNDRFAQPHELLRWGHLLNIAVLVLPGFSHLALHAYIEPLHIAKRLSEEATVSMASRWDGWSGCHRGKWAFHFGRHDH